MRFVVPAAAFIAGFLLCSLLLPAFYSTETFKLYLISAAAGVALAVICAVFVNVCVFFAGGIAGLAALRFTLEYFPAVFGETKGAPLILIGIVLFVVLGLIAVKLQRPVLIVATAYAGAYMMVSSIVSLALRTDPTLITCAVISFFLAGLLAQFKLGKKRLAR